MSNRFFPNSAGYKITSKFGMRDNPVTGIRSMHNGIDLVGRNAKGTSCTDYIMAHTGGTVSAVGYSSVSGNYVKIDVGNNTTMVYYHLKSKSSLKTGASVRKGDIIGYMGSTGNSTGAHLHWGIKVNGQWIDPEPYLDKDYVSVKTVSVDLPVLKKGSKGGSVKALQSLLLSNGYTIVVDGSFGPKTDNALRCYQEDANLEPDGSCGKATWSKLLR